MSKCSSDITAACIRKTRRCRTGPSTSTVVMAVVEAIPVLGVKVVAIAQVVIRAAVALVAIQEAATVICKAVPVPSKTAILTTL